jgi:hypothetical protein
MGPSENPTPHRPKQVAARRGPPARRRSLPRRCLLKGCERWFRPRHPQQRYCSASCRQAARKWSRWKSQARYRATVAGKEKRNGQSRRYRERVRSRKPAEKEAVAEPARVITNNFFRCLLRPAWLLRRIPPAAALAAAAVLLARVPARHGTRMGAGAALVGTARTGGGCGRAAAPEMTLRY